METQISVAKQNGNMVEVYGQQGEYLFSRPGILVGFTSNTIAIQDGNSISVYDSHGSYLFSR